jgi:hypothetical protein
MIQSCQNFSVTLYIYIFLAKGTIDEGKMAKLAEINRSYADDICRIETEEAIFALVPNTEFQMSWKKNTKQLCEERTFVHIFEQFKLQFAAGNKEGNVTEHEKVAEQGNDAKEGNVVEHENVAEQGNVVEQRKVAAEENVAGQENVAEQRKVTEEEKVSSINEQENASVNSHEKYFNEQLAKFMEEQKERNRIKTPDEEYFNEQIAKFTKQENEKFRIRKAHQVCIRVEWQITTFIYCTFLAIFK